MPTARQLCWFKKKGCVSRCLIKIRELESRPISLDAFCDICEPYFTDKLSSYGMIGGANIDLACAALQLPTMEGGDARFDVVRQFFDMGRYVLLKSEVNILPLENDAALHCSLITGMSDLDFDIWTPLQTGGELELKLSRQDWIDKRCSGIVLGP